jgi:uncharacterized membrane protein YuzA (DUF378 family)
MKILAKVCWILILVGALNWGLVGLLNLDLVALIFGHMTILSRIVYIAIGAAAVLKGAGIVKCEHCQKK